MRLSKEKTKKDLDSLQDKYVLINITQEYDTRRKIEEELYAGAKVTITEFEPDKSFNETAEVENIELGQKVYIPAVNKTVYNYLRTEFAEQYNNKHILYLEDKLGKYFTEELESFSNKIAIEQILKNYDSKFDLTKQKDLDELRKLKGNIKFVDLIDYIIKRCKKEENYLQILNQILDINEVTKWDKVQFNIVKENGTDLKKLKSYKLLKEFEKKKLHHKLYEKYNNIKDFIESLLINFIAAQMKSVNGDKFDSLTKQFVCSYHKKSIVTILPENDGFYNYLIELDKRLSIVSLLELAVNNHRNWFEPIFKQLDKYLDELKTEGSYRYVDYLKKNFKVKDYRKILNEDYKLVQEAKLVDEFNDYQNIQSFLKGIKEIKIDPKQLINFQEVISVKDNEAYKSKSYTQPKRNEKSEGKSSGKSIIDDKRTEEFMKPTNWSTYLDNNDGLYTLKQELSGIKNLASSAIVEVEGQFFYHDFGVAEMVGTVGKKVKGLGSDEGYTLTVNGDGSMSISKGNKQVMSFLGWGLEMTVIGAQYTGMEFKDGTKLNMKTTLTLSPKTGKLKPAYSLIADNSQFGGLKQKLSFILKDNINKNNFQEVAENTINYSSEMALVLCVGILICLILEVISLPTGVVVATISFLLMLVNKKEAVAADKEDEGWEDE